MGLLGEIFDITPTGMIVNALGESFGPASISATDQAANIDAIHRFMAETTPLNSKAQELRDDWMKWAAGLTWYQRHADEGVGAEAFNRRNEYMRANVPNAEELAKVNKFLADVPSMNVVTGKPIFATTTGDRIVPPKPLIPTSYKVAGIAAAIGVAALAILTKPLRTALKTLS